MTRDVEQWLQIQGRDRKIIAEQRAEIERLKIDHTEINTEFDRLNGVITQQMTEIERLQARLRTTAQLGITEIGADGPEDAESVMGRIIQRLQSLAHENGKLHGWVNALSQKSPTEHLQDKKIAQLNAQLAESEKAAYDVAGTIEGLKAQLSDSDRKLRELCLSHGPALFRIHDLEKELATAKGEVSWTTERPTESGWYWMKDGSAMAVVQIEIGTFDGFYIEWVWQAGSRTQTPLSCCKDMKWAGPIPEPKEPA